MKIKSVTLRNFRCFGESAVTVELSEGITALVGANGSGKSALLLALARMFGTTQSLRTIRRSDFHVSPGTDPNEREEATLFIEVVLCFPELAEGGGYSAAVPPTFQHMIVTSPGSEPICRLRLEARWADDGTLEGSVDQNLYWILAEGEYVPDDKKQPLLARERGLIQVHYVPANRNPAPELRNVARGRIGRLIRAISWGQGTRDAVEKASELIRQALSSEQPVGAINRALQRRWSELQDDQAAASTELRFAGSSLEEIVRDVGVIFYPVGQGIESDLSALSEGQQSLFYLALLATMFDIERRVSSLASPTSSKSDSASPVDACTDESRDYESDTPMLVRDRLSIPALTVYEIEEPENHLAPHYLARIATLLRSLTENGGVQTLLSSHSPSLLRRVMPEEIRHLRTDEVSQTSMVNRLTLPESTDEAAKFVREAVVAYPELYFGKFVVLAEGPSEEVVLPRIASALNVEIDSSFVCIVPLGGRHVNHFWKLLTALDIPFATLLDLDAGRPTGGWARIKYVCNQLLQIGIEQSKLLKFKYKDSEYGITEDELANLHKKSFASISDFYPWLSHLETFNVYFSQPLDFDLSMLYQIPTDYKSIDGQSGPVFPTAETTEWDRYVRRALAAIVSDDESILDLYMKSSPEWKELYPWYRYLFLYRSKPVTHLRALADVAPDELQERVPLPIRRLLERCKEAINQEPLS